MQDPLLFGGGGGAEVHFDSLFEGSGDAFKTRQDPLVVGVVS